MSNNGNFPSLLVCTGLSTAFPKKGQELVISLLLHGFRALLCLLKLTRLESKTNFLANNHLGPFNLANFGLEIYSNGQTERAIRNLKLLSPQGFRPEAKSRGGTLVTRAYRTVLTVQIYSQYTRKSLDLLEQGPRGIGR